MKKVQLVAQATLPTAYGIFTMVGFEEVPSKKEHMALVYGDVSSGEAILSRIHSECLTGDTLHSLKCDCGTQLDAALKAIVAHGSGILIYHREEGRGIGLINKIRAYALQEQGYDTVQSNQMLGFPPDMRDFSVCTEIYNLLGIKSVNLMTNNPDKVNSLKEAGIVINEIVPLFTGKNKYNQEYLETKKEKMDHLFTDKFLNDKDQIKVDD